ncbi:hypothetical protein Clocl_0970 [Acetivibrio clariflavus DSM 19732]|uniref:Protein CR006 P-loop domain-containing protein n=2 Tax=Acetivibrio clariflavus TaxID=288965 RepID=G8LWZ5_ACECE|nr:hypothetical protein Clocl_0970 [Acetivibrio clariflavus DSM 19732]
MLSKLFCLYSEVEDEEYKQEIADELFDNDTVIEFNIDNKNEQCKKGVFPKHKIYVFNANFVTNNLRDEGSSVKVKNFNVPSNIRLENKEIKKINSEIEELKKDLEEKEKELKKITDIEKTVSTKIKHKYNEVKELEGTRLTIDYRKINFSEVRQLKHIDEDIKENVIKLNISKFNNNKEDIFLLSKIMLKPIFINKNNLQVILKKNIIATSNESVLKKIERISQIIGGKESQQWLMNGYKLLSDSKEPVICPLCNTDITTVFKSLIMEYESFFNREFESFQNELQEQISYIKSIIEYLLEKRENRLNNIFGKYTFLIKRERDELEIEEKLITSILDELKNIVRLLEEKKSKTNIVKDYNFEKIELLIDEYNKKVDEYNSIKNIIMTYIENNENNQNQLISKIKNLFLEKYYIEFIEMSKMKEPGKYINELEAKVNDLKTAIQNKEIKLREELGKMKFESKYVNEYLLKLNVTRFSVNIDDTLEVIYKESNKVKKSIKHSLSEGEKTTLALAYFLSKVRVEVAGPKKDYNKEYEKCTFYIDDPVSSLDENRLFYTANLLYNEFHMAEQLFVSSHNLKFLKILINYKFTDKQINLYEIKYDKFSQIRNLPKTLWNFNTSYYYRLQQILDYLDGKVDYNTAICYIPNNIRVVLESFLSFKFCYLSSSKSIGYTPGLPDLIEWVKNENKNYFKNLQNVGDITKENWKDHLSIVISKISDSFSHGSPANQEITFNPISEKELKKICRTVIDLMQFMDNVHIEKSKELGANAL